ncbi:TetR/AcrR family transcriptional regulator [Streptococcus pacificus]|uniref:TetR/AcrR family transcriptional regulator n=1 Tax=Streptococcus pacificus TaxID=2740577 RepID=A0ABS0ZHC3_9STRE|nr:TetR/AcrR family transcriptional regulator [Streptococcus pacificus]MBJ8325128.1 TetR/AcrR family transcriptional regulator [Streptococcus pacificus]
MAKKEVSPISIKNLEIANQESKKITKESIEIALLTLLENKTIKQITISELVAKAGVSRNAFYRHFNSKEDILKNLITRTVRKIFRGIKSFNLKTQTYQAWLYLFTEAKKEAYVLKIALKHHLHSFLTDLVARRFRAYQKYRRKKISTYSTSFFSTAIISVLANWINDGMITPVEEMAAIGLPLMP